jgi:hypothetical protein
MDSLRITTGEKRIAINDDPERMIVFNPSDVNFAQRFYDLIHEFEEKLKDYQARGEVIDADVKVDQNGIPVNMGAKLALLREACEFIRGKIDHLFGAGTSQRAFGDTLDLGMFTQFFEGITPFIQAARVEKVAKYAPIVGGKKRRRSVMK